MTKYFVMLSHPVGYPTPVVVSDDDDSTALFDSEAEANAKMRGHMAAQAWGYDVYPWDGGVAAFSEKRGGAR